MKSNNHKSKHTLGNESKTIGNTTKITSYSTNRSRIYRTTATGNNNISGKWSTREIAALDFLLGIPLQEERSIIKAGVEGESSRSGSAHQNVGITTDVDDGDVYSNRGKIEEEDDDDGQRWWEKLITKERKKSRVGLELEELERPGLEEDDVDGENKETDGNDNPASKWHMKEEGRLNATTAMTTASLVAPGRRLEGRDAVIVTMPKTVMYSKRPSTEAAKTRQHNVTHLAAVREWEVCVAHGVGQGNNNSLLDGRVFFSSRGSYPAGVFSVIKYEPKKEEAARRRKKLEELGGGGTQFVMPQRDWRGVSYRSLLSHRDKIPKAFNKYHRTAASKSEQNKNHSSTSSSSSFSDESSVSSSSSDESDTYHVGFLDDPMIVQGKHRHVMIGDKNTGPILSSTILFVKPQQLKKELNKQFRERFDGWEPPKPNRKYIGARVIDGVYTLHDPTDSIGINTNPNVTNHPNNVRNIVEEENSSHLLRMPPSLTLSKIRNIKEQALYVGIKADLEISTVALSCIYFERLALDCRVDKSNRRLAFAACLLLASKTNETNVAIVHNHNDTTTKTSGSDDSTTIETKSKYFLPAKVRQTNKGTNIMTSLLEFFTHDWSLSLKHIFAAEWGVFVALGFNLNATPTQISFHFKRLMKELERNPLPYLGHEMYTQWQQCLQDDTIRKERHEKRKEKRRRLKERKLLQLQRDLQLIQERKQQQGEESRRSSSSLKRNSMSSYISESHSRRNSNYSLKQEASSEAATSSSHKNHDIREDKSSFDSNAASMNASNTASKNRPSSAKISDSTIQPSTAPSSSIINRSKSVSSSPAKDNKAVTPLKSSTTPTSLWSRIKRQTEPILSSYTQHSIIYTQQEDGNSVSSEKHETTNKKYMQRSISFPDISSLN